MSAMGDHDMLTELWAKDRIRECKARYCHLLDGRRFSELVESCFSADDPIVDFTPQHELVQGVEAVRRFYGEYVPSIRDATAHRIGNGVIQVDGESALASWYMDGSLTIAGEPYAVQGVYNDEFRLEGDDWRIAVLDLQWEYLHHTDEGWVRPRRPPCQPWTGKDAGKAVA
jgi:ketosteroid isomerase-like protein